MDHEVVEAQYTVGDRLLDKIDELKEGSREVAENIQKLTYYVVVIGALNGTITVGKIAEQVTGQPIQQKVGEVFNDVRS